MIFLAEISPVSGRVEEMLLTVIVQLIVMLAAARAVGWLFRWLGQPQVVGEIAAGLLLGPSCFGYFFPDLAAQVFPSTGEVPAIFSTISQIGLIMLMFLIGLEFDFSHLHENRRATTAIAITGIALPFALGLALAYWLHPRVAAEMNQLGFALFMGTALSITAIPILGRIMMEFNITKTRLGAIAITAAAINDVAGWIILAMISAIVRAQFEPATAGQMILWTGLYAGALATIGRKLARWLIARVKLQDGRLSQNALAVVLLAVFGSALVTNRIGIFAIFGGFLLGAILYDQHQFADALKRRLQDFVFVFFLPIFFAYTGLLTNVRTMDSLAMWGFCGLVVAAAIVGKFAGCALAARACGLPAREAASIGVMMNTRALMELIVINMGRDLGVIPDSVFFMLILMALVTTFMASPILRWLIKGSELEAHYADSDFARAHAARGQQWRRWLGGKSAP